MLKRTVPAILPALVMLMALVLLTEPSRALAPAPGMKSEVQPGQWRDYNPAKERGSKGKAGHLPSGTLVVIAYIIVWAVVLLYVVVLALRQRRLRAEVEQLCRRLDEVELPAGAVDPEKT